MSENGEFIQEVKMVPVEVDLDEKTLDTLQYLSEKTGFTIDKIVEYAIGDMIIQEALVERRTLKAE